MILSPDKFRLFSLDLTLDASVAQNLVQTWFRENRPKKIETVDLGLGYLDQTATRRFGHLRREVEAERESIHRRDYGSLDPGPCGTALESIIQLAQSSFENINFRPHFIDPFAVKFWNCARPVSISSTYLDDFFHSGWTNWLGFTDWTAELRAIVRKRNFRQPTTDACLACDDARTGLRMSCTVTLSFIVALVLVYLSCPSLEFDWIRRHIHLVCCHLFSRSDEEDAHSELSSRVSQRIRGSTRNTSHERDDAFQSKKVWSGRSVLAAA
jgi:hypothetical protein